MTPQLNDASNRGSGPRWHADVRRRTGAVTQKRGRVTWFWLNVPLAALFFAAWSGIPLWLVLRHLDREPAIQVPGQAAQAAPGDPRLERVRKGWQPTSV
jgi:hypothetical protein